MSDQWFFEIGDGKTYGPFPLDKLKKWAEVGNLMPTHRVRNADAEDWTIAAYVPGLELTAEDATLPTTSDDDQKKKPSARRPLGRFGRKAKADKKTSTGVDKSPQDVAAKPAEPPDIVALCDHVLQTAYQRAASDIHIDAEEHIVLVQLRVDGQLEALRKLPKSLLNPVIGRLKVLANMDIAERRMPQDGQFIYRLGKHDHPIHIRAACLPTTHGERMTLRLLARETAQLTLDKLGMSSAALDTFAHFTGLEQGLILLTGPTGSGKSTTLYAALRHRLAHHPGKVITVEDPVEFDIIGVAQAEVDTADKLQFNSALRNILRSDPDVIMIGEIRDHDSADIAIKAALTGHLVFSSLHTNSAAAVITRLVDMGIERFLVAATLRLCVAQRLVRMLCKKCRKERALTQAEAMAIGRPASQGATIYDPGGCEECNERGFRGRIGLFELLPLDEDLCRRIVDGCDEAEIADHSRRRGNAQLRDDAAQKLLDGQTSFQELASIAALW